MGKVKEKENGKYKEKGNTEKENGKCRKRKGKKNDIPIVSRALLLPPPLLALTPYFSK